MDKKFIVLTSTRFAYIVPAVFGEREGIKKTATLRPWWAG